MRGLRGGTVDWVEILEEPGGEKEGRQRGDGSKRGERSEDSCVAEKEMKRARRVNSRRLRSWLGRGLWWCSLEGEMAVGCWKRNSSYCRPCEPPASYKHSATWDLLLSRIQERYYIVFYLCRTLAPVSYARLGLEGRPVFLRTATPDPDARVGPSFSFPLSPRRSLLARSCSTLIVRVHQRERFGSEMSSASAQLAESKRAQKHDMSRPGPRRGWRAKLRLVALEHTVSGAQTQFGTVTS